jgi:NTP pyrophosphatase (non-canonical NTP hydrolase)
MTIREFQDSIRAQYFAKDSARGVGGTFLWFVEEIGELAEALRHGTPEEKNAEFADVLAWLSTLASMAGVDLEAAAAGKYGKGCPRCGGTPCRCPEPAAK